MLPIRPGVRCACAVLCVLASSLACGPNEGCNDTAQCLSPKLHVTACAEPPGMIGGEVVGGVSSCGLDFGAIATTADERIRLTNGSILDVEYSVAIEDDADDAVELALVGETVGVLPSGASVDAVVRAAPVARGPASMTLAITTNANNLPAEADGKITVPVVVFSTAVFDVSTEPAR